MNNLKKSLLLISVCLVCTYCTNKVDKESGLTISLTDSIETDKEREIKKYSTIFEEPFNLDSIKNKYREYTTSTLLSIKQTELFYRQNDNGYYGQYNLIEKSSNGFKRIGMLTVFNNINPWIFENETDKFTEIICKESGIYVYDSICIGTEIHELMNKLGKPNIKEGDHIIYYDEENLVMIFKIIDNKVNWFRIGYYKPDIIDRIELLLNR
jgi:hypothetical protein